MYDTAKAAIEDIDQQLDAVSNSEGAAKRRVSDELAELNKDVWEKTVEQLVAQLESMDQEKRTGAFYGFTRGLNKKFGKEASKFVDILVASQPQPEVEPVNEEELKTLQSQRTSLRAQLVSIVDLAEKFNEIKKGEWEVPAARRGSVGKRGKRALSLFSWQINGEDVEDDDNSPAGVSALLGFGKASEFTQALKDKAVTPGIEKPGINTTKPPKEFTYTHTDGRVVYAFNESPETTEDEAVEAEETEEVEEEV